MPIRNCLLMVLVVFSIVEIKMNPAMIDDAVSKVWLELDELELLLLFCFV
jgi:hypothetical protein